MYEYEIEDKYGSANTHQKININEQDYGLLVGNFVSSVLIEGKLKNNFYFTDSMLGEFSSLTQTLSP